MSTATIRRWAWLPVLVLGLTLFEAVRETLLTSGNEALAPTLVLLGALVLPAAFVTFVAGRGMPSTAGAATLAMVALGGGAVGVILAGFVEFETLQRLGTAAKVGVAVIEETAKLLVPAGLLLLHRPRRLSDGLLIGMASGAGFAALETMGYAFTTVVNEHGNLATVTNLLLVRGLWSPAGHMAWTGVTAAALYDAAGKRFTPRSCGILAGTFGIAVTLHTAWDSLQNPLAYAIIAVIGLSTLGMIVHRTTVLAASAARPFQTICM